MLIHRLIGIELTVSHLPCTDNGKSIHLHSITRRFLFTVKETVKDYVPVDSESVTHNMWVLLIFRSVMVHR